MSPDMLPRSPRRVRGPEAGEWRASRERSIFRKGWLLSCRPLVRGRSHGPDDVPGVGFRGRLGDEQQVVQLGFDEAAVAFEVVPVEICRQAEEPLESGLGHHGHGYNLRIRRRGQSQHSCPTPQPGPGAAGARAHTGTNGIRPSPATRPVRRRPTQVVRVPADFRPRRRRARSRRNGNRPTSGARRPRSSRSSRSKARA